MVEHGVTVELRSADGRIAAAGAAARAARVQAAALARWRAARTDLERLAVADDYAAAAAAAAGRGGVDTHPGLDRATRVLWAVGESLVRQLAETELGDV